MIMIIDSFLQVVIEVVVDEAVEEVRQADEEHPEVVVGDVEEVVEEHRQSWNLMHMLECSSPKEKNICWSPRVSFQVKLFMVKNGYRWTEMWRAPRSNIVYGIHSGASWLLVCSVDSSIFSSPLA